MAPPEEFVCQPPHPGAPVQERLVTLLWLVTLLVPVPVSQRQRGSARGARCLQAAPLPTLPVHSEA